MSVSAKSINYALVEGVRPHMYAAMKYWGKKPHNIWREYIKAYAPEGSAVLDVFAGSGIAAFEAVKAGRKAVVFDINPLTSFLIEAYCTELNEAGFRRAVEGIVAEIEQDDIYRGVFSTRCDSCGCASANTVQHCKWEGDEIYEVGVLRTCSVCDNGARYLRRPNDSDRKNARKLNANDFDKAPLSHYWIPSREFHESPSFSADFIEKIGGRRFLNLWTGRNLYVLARIFDLILRYEDEGVKRHLVLGFVQVLHLCSQMCVPRRAAAARPYSTSWGRSAYICADRRMEMNPLLLFRRNCLDNRQSVLSSVLSVRDYIGKIPKIVRIEKGKVRTLSKNYDIKYGVVDAASMDGRHVSERDGVKFVITDPPYGGLVQYLDLSSVWLVWLEKYDSRMRPNYDCEITIKAGVQELEIYQRRMLQCFRNIGALLPDDGKVVFTFHNKELSIWNAFLHGLFEAGFVIEKVIHQPNRRTGETNVANPYGTSANDFYIRCAKARAPRSSYRARNVEDVVVKEAIKIIAMRNEPTPYLMLFSGLLAEISMKGFRMENVDNDIESILDKRVGKEFVIVKKGGKGGSLWWFAAPAVHIKNPDMTLSDRVRVSVLRILRHRVSVTLDEVLAEIYVKYPNGMTPDKKSVLSYLNDYATRSQGKWLYRRDDITGIGEHTEILRMLAVIGRKMGFQVHIGKRERSERCGDKKLSDYADTVDLRKISASKIAAARINQIDMLWVGVDGVAYAIEVENTTSFVHGIQRASNLGAATPKIMVIPDDRLPELKRALRDDLTRQNFHGQNWRYLAYSGVRTLSGKRQIAERAWKKFLVALDGDEDSGE